MKCLFSFILLVAAYSIQAQDRIFTYTYQSSVLNKGQRELEMWNTLRTGKADYYARFDHRSEFEMGLGNNIQTSFYLNLSSITNTLTTPTDKSLETVNEISFSNEWKYKILDPVANSIGLALYGELGVGSKEYEFEGKLIVDKKINDLTIAANASYELELEAEPKPTEVEFETENKADFNLALAYSFSPKFHLTCENTYRNVFLEGTLEHSALYSGLGCSFVQENFWLNLTVLPQIKSFKGQTNNSLNLNEYEKIQFRLLFSYAF